MGACSERTPSKQSPHYFTENSKIALLIPLRKNYRANYRASIPRGRGAYTCAAEVPADYETGARKVGAEYHGWPYQRGGPPGPVLTLLRSLPPVTGLGVGFAGEFSREVGQLISAVAEKGAVVPERFGCCHSSDQARGVIASFVRRAFGRTSLRGVARTRQAVLAAVLGGATRADSFADGDMAGAESAWGASGGLVHGGAPPQLQTGGGTSPRVLALRQAHSSLDQHLSYVVFS